MKKSINPLSTSEKLLIEEMMQAARNLRASAKGLSMGELVKLIRSQLGMSQTALAKRAGVPQPTISRLERGQTNLSLSTLEKILKALSCDLVIAPALLEPIETMRRKQARKVAEKRISYLKGTMNMEEQQPDPRFIEELLKHEEEQLLLDNKLWDD